MRPAWHSSLTITAMSRTVGSRRCSDVCQAHPVTNCGSLHALSGCSLPICGTAPVTKFLMTRDLMELSIDARPVWGSRRRFTRRYRSERAQREADTDRPLKNRLKQGARNCWGPCVRSESVG